MPDIFVADTNSQSPAENKNEATNNQPSQDTAVKQAKPINKQSSQISHDSSGNSGSVHLFTSYCENPDDISFENQEDGEKVLLFIRKDLITNLPWVLTGIVLIILPLLLMPLLSVFKLTGFNLPQNYMFVITIFYYLFVATFIFINFITWYFNVDIVTDRRVIDIAFEGIVYKDVAATKLTLVQDVSFTQIGVVRTMFDYGNVLVQTAGTIDNFTFDAVPRPEDAVHVVEGLIGKRNEQF